MDYSQLLALIPPAIAISLFVYLIHFFGKIIADQEPVVDDRKWHVQLAGTMFMVNMLSGLLGIYLANLAPWGLDAWWLHGVTFFVLSFLAGVLYCNNLRESTRVFNYKKNMLAAIEKRTDGFVTFYARIGDFIGVGILPVVLFYFGTLEFLSGNIYWTIFFASMIFLVFIFSAYNYSLRRLKDITPVDIHFIDKERETIVGARILKMNDDNVRARVGDTILILNKSEILKTEMVIPEHLR